LREFLIFPQLILGFNLQSSLDELADGFRPGWDAVGPSELIDLLDEFGWHGDNDAWIFYFWSWARAAWGHHGIVFRRSLVS
jgi:hypothetical protein